MSSPAACRAAVAPPRPAAAPLSVAFVGARVWLDGCAPSAPTHGLHTQRFAVGGEADAARALAGLAELSPQVTVLFDPPSLPAEVLQASPGATLGVLVGPPDRADLADGARPPDRLVCFRPALTGVRTAAGELWRAIPPPVSDALFAEPFATRQRDLRAPRAIALGRSSEHREAMLMPAKHHHDLLQVIHGVSGPDLHELLAECDVGVYVAPEPGGGFGQQVGVHLAAGQLLLAEELSPAHGLERNIDYLHFDSPDGLVWVLDRLARFPGMHHRIRVRGRLKAEQYRASRLFARLAHDLLADIAAFGPGRAAS